MNNNATSSYYRGYLNYNNVVFFGEINFNNLIGSIQSEKGREGALVFFYRCRHDFFISLAGMAGQKRNGNNVWTRNF